MKAPSGIPRPVVQGGTGGLAAYPAPMNPSDYDQQKVVADDDRLIRIHPHVDDTAGDEGIDDQQPDDTGEVAAP